VTEAVIEVGPCAVRGPNSARPECVSAALECIDDDLALLDEVLVPVQNLWEDVICSVVGDGIDAVVVMCPTWWSSSRVDRVRRAALTAAATVTVVRRTEVFRDGFADRVTTIVELAEELVVVSHPGGTLAVVGRQGGSSDDVVAVVAAVGPSAAVLLDAPVGLVGAELLAAAVADGLRERGVTVTFAHDLLRAGQRMGHGLNLFHYWLREWLRLDRPYNEVVTELLTGGGKTSFSIPGGLYFARDFVKAKDDPDEEGALDLLNIPDTIDEFTITYSKVLLGLNLSCISCHDGKHHLEQVNLFLTGKKREDFFRQAGFYGKTRQLMNWEGGSQANTEYTVDDLGSGYDTKALSILRIPRSGGSGEPRFLLTGETPRPGYNERDELARLLTGHIQFSRAFTNRIWAELMGFGIVEPVDDFDLDRYDPKNPPPAPWTLQPSNPELLDALAVSFQKSNYSFRTVVRTIMKSSAYQLSSRFDGEWKQDYAPYYARKYVRMLTAAELHDSITVATSRPGSFSSGTTKVAMIQQMSEPKKAPGDVQNFMRIFGQSTRDDMPKKTMPSSLQAMMLMQSKIVTDRVLALGNSRVEQLLQGNQTEGQLLDALYLATLSRRPTGPESEVGIRALSKDRRRGAENLQWALINSPEFLFNY